MGAFDRLMSFHSNLRDEFAEKAEESEKATQEQSINQSTSISSNRGQNGVSALDFINEDFPNTTPVGYFLQTLHKEGYAVVERMYKNDHTLISVNEYNALSEEDRKDFVDIGYCYTEFANMLLAKGDNLVIAGAGSGKTTALVFRIMMDIISGEALTYVKFGDNNPVPVVDKMFVGTFLRSGAEELKQAVQKWQSKLGYMITADRINFGTLHAEFKRALNDMGIATPIGTPEQIRACLKTAIHSLNITRSDGRKMGFDDYTAIESIVAYYRNRLGAERYKHPACEEYTLLPTVLDKLVQIFYQQRNEKGIMDFEDLQELLYIYLYLTPNKSVQDFIANRYRYIYLDEFQDTSEIQYAILKFYARGRLAINKQDSSISAPLTEEQLADVPFGLYTGQPSVGKIIAIGDDDQCIYSWRGSDIDVMCDKYPKDFAPTTLTITRNYRCPSNILKPVLTSIVKNQKRFPKNLRSAQTGGEFAAYHFMGITPMLQDLKKQIDDDMVNGRSVAIVCRTNFDGAVPAFLLEIEHKYKFSVSSEAMTFGSALPKGLINICCLFFERSSANVQHSLELIEPRAKWDISSLMQKLQSDNSVGIHSSIWTLDEDDLKWSLGDSSKLVSCIQNMKSMIFDSQGSKIAGGDIAALKFLYLYMIESVYDSDSAYAMKAKAYIEAILFALNTKTYTDVRDFYSALSDYGEYLSSRVRVKNAPISIVTVHEFKGKERDSVYVWHSSDKFFPSSMTDLEVTSQVEEERRVHYIACTRAKKKCVVYSLRNAHGMFFNELDCKPVDPTFVGGTLAKNNNLSLASSSLVAQSQLRGVLGVISEKGENQDSAQNSENSTNTADNRQSSLSSIPTQLPNVKNIIDN